MWRSAGTDRRRRNRDRRCFRDRRRRRPLPRSQAQHNWLMYLGLFFGLRRRHQGLMRVVKRTSARCEADDRKPAERTEAVVLARIERINLILAARADRAGGRAVGRARRARRGRRRRCSPAPTSGCWRASATRLVASARDGQPVARPVWPCCSARSPRCSRWCSSRSRVLHLEAMPFALGFSVFVVSIMMLGLRAGPTR